eukprot:TRINITY_DN22158_c0_g1_i2.p1 TRINITY_DN22158_c0_g1~~TRINITY_DN22158_c0_g1_i2.p1  ORF type:complete len:856 (-),score=212.29 TRINITY_DN22158_c0_g1_i2:119-2686(-)
MLWGVFEPVVAARSDAVSEDWTATVLEMFLKALQEMEPWVDTLFAEAQDVCFSESAQCYAGQLVAILLLPNLRIDDGLGGQLPRLATYAAAVLLPLAALRDAACDLLRQEALLRALRLDAPSASVALTACLVQRVLEERQVHDGAAGSAAAEAVARMRRLLEATLEKVSGCDGFTSSGREQEEEGAGVMPLLHLLAVLAQLPSHCWGESSQQAAAQVAVKVYYGQALAGTLRRRENEAGKLPLRWQLPHQEALGGAASGLRWLLDGGEASLLRSAHFATDVFSGFVCLGGSSSASADDAAVAARALRGRAHALLLESLPSPAAAVELLTRSFHAATDERLPAVLDFSVKLMKQQPTTLAVLSYQRFHAHVAARLQDAVAASSDAQPAAAQQSEASRKSCAAFLVKLLAIQDGGGVEEVAPTLRALQRAAAMKIHWARARLLQSLALLFLRGRSDIVDSLLSELPSVTASVRGCFRLAAAPTDDWQRASAASCLAAAFLVAERAGSEQQGVQQSAVAAFSALAADVGRAAWQASLCRSLGGLDRAAAALALAAWHLRDAEGASAAIGAQGLGVILAQAASSIAEGGGQLRDGSCLLLVVALSAQSYTLRSRICLLNSLTFQKHALESACRAPPCASSASLSERPPGAERQPSMSNALLIYIWFLAINRPVWFNAADALLAVAREVGPVNSQGAALGKGCGSGRLALLRAAEALLKAVEGQHETPQNKPLTADALFSGDFSSAPAGVPKDKSALQRARQTLTQLIGNSSEWQHAYAEEDASAAAPCREIVASVGIVRQSSAVETSKTTPSTTNMEGFLPAMVEAVSRRICATLLKGPNAAACRQFEAPSKRLRTGYF